MGGVNLHHSQHCHLAKFRPVVWRSGGNTMLLCDWLSCQPRVFVYAQSTFPARLWDIFSQSPVRNSPWSHNYVELRQMWEGSTTVVYTVVWRNSVVWWSGWNTALWLAKKRIFWYVTSYNFQAGFCKPITAPYLTMIIRPRNIAKPQSKLQWLTPPKDNSVGGLGFRV